MYGEKLPMIVNNSPLAGLTGDDLDKTLNALQQMAREHNEVREYEAREHSYALTRKAEIERDKEVGVARYNYLAHTEMARTHAHKEVELAKFNGVASIALAAMQSGLICGQFRGLKVSESSYNLLIVKGRSWTIKFF